MVGFFVALADLDSPEKSVAVAVFMENAPSNPISGSQQRAVGALKHC
jgi:hypothetical protein